MAGRITDTEKPLRMQLNQTPLLQCRATSEDFYRMGYNIGTLAGRPAVIAKRCSEPHFRYPRAQQDCTRISVAGTASAVARKWIK